MASSHSNAARKKSGSRTKKTAVAAAENASPKVDSQNAAAKAESKKKSEAVATVKTAANITEISVSRKNAGPGKLKLWTDSVQRFLKSVRSEMDRVTWPSWKELRSSTIVVVLTLLLVSCYMGLVDWVLSLLFGTPKTGF